MSKLAECGTIFARIAAKEAVSAFLSLTGSLVALPSPEDFDTWFRQQTILPVDDNYGNGVTSTGYRACRRLWQYLREAKAMIVSCASRSLTPHFEIRGDSQEGITSCEVVGSVLDQVLNQMAAENPSLKVTRCGECRRIHYSTSRVLTKPLGRGVRLYPEGTHREEQFYDEHVKLNPHKYLCDKWSQINEMVITTDGYPQLCYSNVALTPKIRTKRGPNLYRDGFHAIHRFYRAVWQRQADFIRDNLPELVKTRPNMHYCPLFVFRAILGQPEFQEDGKGD